MFGLVEVTRAHAPYADHAWISRVAVEPTLHGAGIGKALVDAAFIGEVEAPVKAEEVTA